MGHRWAFFAAMCMPATAWAQAWPSDDQWRVLTCGDEPSFDAVRDAAGATGERDIVGDADHPALYLFSDDTHLFLRMRVDSDPWSGEEFRPFGWAVEFETDGDRSTYEVLAGVDGIVNPEVVILRANTVQRTPNDPSDPPETTLGTQPAATHARGTPAEGAFASTFGDGPGLLRRLGVSARGAGRCRCPERCRPVARNGNVHQPGQPGSECRHCLLRQPRRRRNHHRDVHRPRAPGRGGRSRTQTGTD